MVQDPYPHIKKPELNQVMEESILKKRGQPLTGFRPSWPSQSKKGRLQAKYQVNKGKERKRVVEKRHDKAPVQGNPLTENEVDIVEPCTVHGKVWSQLIEQYIKSSRRIPYFVASKDRLGGELGKTYRYHDWLRLWRP